MFSFHLTLFLIVAVVEAQIYDCPDDWITYSLGQRCYKFISVPRARHEEALALCVDAAQSAYLLTINDEQEHNFINEWLQTNDVVRREWYTSGRKDLSSPSGYIWEGDNTQLKFDLNFWNPGAQFIPGNRISYKYNGASYGWSHTSANVSLSYICEISQFDAYTIIQQKRDFSYGVFSNNKEDIKYGPTFTIHPEDVTMIARTTSLFIECRASANPPPSYKWLRGPPENQTVITPSLDTRYTTTNGKLSIQNPRQSDEETYQCQADNQFGTIISHPVNIRFGYLGDFSNVENAAISSPAFDGAVIECSKISYNPAVVYNWRKQAKGQRFPVSIYTDQMPYIFKSNNGKLYFSEVTTEDEADYYCEVTLHGLAKSNAEGSSQPPSRISRKIPLDVTAQAAKTDWGPIIQNDFIEVFPNPPLRGQNIRMECFAYGSSANYAGTWSYSWKRLNGLIPSRTKYLDLNRAMEIENVQYEDEGIYECVVTRKGSTASKQISFSIESKPYFLVPLEHKHLDEGVDATWKCLAFGKPTPQYTWYKDGVPIQSDSNLKVDGNVLKIINADKDIHNGMYQCGATNVHGTSLSAAQVRVLGFAPSFIKNRLPESLDAALKGEVIIACEPEAAPKPIIEWSKNNIPISSNARVQIMPNGYLKITDINYGDQGFYECKATNKYDTDSSICKLNVKLGTTITRGPLKDTRVQQNKTALLLCEASHDPALDLVYVWKFFDKVIDVEKDPHFQLATLPSARGLWIRMAQFYHEGKYECIAKTPLNEAKAEGMVTVLGPPGMPAGLYADPGTATQNSIDIFFFNGDDHEFAIEYYIVEYEIQSDKGNWQYTPGSHIILAATTLLSANLQNNMRTANVQGLDPGNSYSFRLKAVNIQGIGPPSLPSIPVNTKEAPPSEAPKNVSGRTENVEVGQLMITWIKLPLRYHGGKNLGYRVYWRLLRNSVGEDTWNKKEIYNWQTEYFVTQVGLDNFYRQYEVKIQAFNDRGSGRNSSIAIVYSAMGMPIGVPTKIWAEGYNSTAATVHWTPIENTREKMNGFIGGYQCNYYLKTKAADDKKDYPYRRSIRFAGNVNTGIVIGLEADTYYYFDVQVYTDAGLGPLGERYPAETFNPAPGLYPQEVTVLPKGSETVTISWRGVSTGPSEDTLRGYQIYVWKSNEHFRTAKPIEVPKFPTKYDVTGIEKDFVYSVRIAGYSLGGIGRKSPTLHFTLAGSRVPIDRTITKQELAGSSRVTPQIVLLSFLCFVFIHTANIT